MNSTEFKTALKEVNFIKEELIQFFIEEVFYKLLGKTQVGDKRSELFHKWQDTFKEFSKEDWLELEEEARLLASEKILKKSKELDY